MRCATALRKPFCSAIRVNKSQEIKNKRSCIKMSILTQPRIMLQGNYRMGILFPFYSCRWF